jgi:hypothetical protein
MSNYLEAIPPAVAAIVAAVPRQLGAAQSEADLDKIQKRVIDLTDRLTRTFAKALIDAQAGNP